MGSPSLPVGRACVRFCFSGWDPRKGPRRSGSAQGRRPAVQGSCRQCDLDIESLALLRSRWRQNLMSHNRHRRRRGPLVRDGSWGSHGVRAGPRTAPQVLVHTRVPAHSPPRPTSASPSRRSLPVGVRRGRGGHLCPLGRVWVRDVSGAVASHREHPGQP